MRHFQLQLSKVKNWKKSGKMVAYPPVLSFSLAYLEGPTANEEKTLSLFFKSATWQTTLSWNNDIFTNVFLFSCGIFDKDDEGSLKSYLFSVASCRCRLCCTEFYAWNAASKEVDFEDPLQHFMFYMPKLHCASNTISNHNPFAISATWGPQSNTVCNTLLGSNTLFENMLKCLIWQY